MATVLLIDDDAESRRATGELFVREKWNVLEAGDGEAGIELALKHLPDLILCDLLMPKASGFQVCRSIRQKLRLARIVIISGRDYGVDRTSAIEAGADEYLVKPVRWENLREVIERVMPAPDGALQTGPLPQFVLPSTRVKFWGVRGSIPVPGSSTVGYGGNTSCVEVRADGEIIILDAGSGLRELGIALEEEFGDRPIRPTLLISHTHWDHIQGLPFFAPLFQSGNDWHVFGPRGLGQSLAHTLAGGVAVQQQALVRLVGQHDVLGDREHRHEHEVLVHHPDAQVDRGLGRGDRHRPAVDADVALVGLVALFHVDLRSWSGQ